MTTEKTHVSDDVLLCGRAQRIASKYRLLAHVGSERESDALYVSRTAHRPAEETFVVTAGDPRVWHLVDRIHSMYPGYIDGVYYRSGCAEVVTWTPVVSRRLDFEFACGDSGDVWSVEFVRDGRFVERVRTLRKRWRRLLPKAWA